MSVLFVLKIIGIILLVILGVLLILVALVLFWPVKFGVDIHSSEDIKADGFVRWLGRLLNITFSYEKGDVSFKIKVLFFTIKTSEKSSEEKDISTRDDTNEEPFGTMDYDGFKEISEPEHTNSETGTEELHTKENIPEGASREKKGIGAIFKMIFSDESKDALSVLLKRLRTLLRHIRFKDLKGDVSFSTGSPDITGIVTGILSWFPVAYGKNLSIAPDFLSDEAYLKGDISARASLRLFFVLLFVLGLIFNKKIRRFISRIRNK